MAVYDVKLIVSVSDPQVLWMKARNYLLSNDPDPETVRTLIGTSARPKVGACLAMLLDRSEHLDGAEVMQHEVEELED